MPSAKQIRELPFVPGKMSLSAINGRNWLAVRASGRIGGLCERDVWRYESSAGLSRTCWVADGAIAASARIIDDFELGVSNGLPQDVVQPRIFLRPHA